MQLELLRRGALAALAAPLLLLGGCSDAESGHDHAHHGHGDMAAQASAEGSDEGAQPAPRNPAGGSALPYYGDAAFTPVWLEGSDKALDSFHAVPDFAFTNQDGETISSEVYDDTIYVATFFFATCPGICSPVNERVAKVQDAFADDDEVRILSHSITPEIDTVEVLHTYAADHGVQSGKWDLVTGDRDALYAVAKAGYFASEDMGDPEARGDFKHTENVLLIDKDRRIRGIYNGLSRGAMTNLIADIRLLKAQQADG